VIESAHPREKGAKILLGQADSDTTYSSPEVKLRVWRVFSRAVAGLHAQNTLRDDIDDVHRAIYNPTAETISFRPVLVRRSLGTTPTTARQLAYNLVPLMQFVFTNRGSDQAVGIWRVFEEVYVEAMDERGPEVISTLRAVRRDLQQASQLNMEALGLAYVGKLDEAKAIFQQVLRIRGENGDHEGYCRTLCNLALMCADMGEFGEAQAILDEAIQRAREYVRIKAWALVLFQKGLLSDRQGNRAGALQCTAMAIRTWEQTGLPLPEQFATAYESLGGGLNDVPLRPDGHVPHEN